MKANKTETVQFITAIYPGVSETMRQCAFAHLGDKVRLETPTFYQHAGVIGAAALALDGFFYQQVEASA